MNYGLFPGGKNKIKDHCWCRKNFSVPYYHLVRVGAAVECIHAYSLIHDDLPCMDNDDLRRES